MNPLARTMNHLSEADRRTLRWITQGRHPLSNRIMRGFTRAGDWQSWSAVLLSGFAAGGPYRALALRVTPRLLATLGVVYGIKALSRRKRPSVAMGDLSPLLSNPDPYSFPSSHAACAWVVSTTLGLALGWGWSIWILYAAAVSYSRIHVGAHYPLDVLMGALIGIVIGIGMASV